MARKLEERLRDYGCTMDAERFKELLADLMSNLYRDWNDEDLMHRPQEALRYCQEVRRAANCFDLPDELILRALSGTRKHPGG